MGRRFVFAMLLWFLPGGFFMARSQGIDLSKAVIVHLGSKDKLLQKAAAVLQEEVVLRSGITWPFAKKEAKTGRFNIVLGIAGQLQKLSKTQLDVLWELAPTAAEGYKIAILPDVRTLLVIGHDSRGVLYGVGKLLRKMEMAPGRISVREHLRLSASPKYQIRGHQLGYRPKTNAYDAFSVAQFDDYIRDMAIFGANSIEIMPPRTDDDFTSIHMEIPAIEMIAEQSRICNSYGMDVWMWYPNMGEDYKNPDAIQVELAERRKVFKKVKRLNALFVPGGDPGNLEPDVLFEWLEKEALVLREYHPNAKIWVSPQAFRPTKKWYDDFYRHVNREYDWFGGIVFGPWIKTPIQEIRQRINPGIPIRRYPDITHSLSAQYPIPQWDLAHATTLGRECINPRPRDQKFIHNALDEYAQGSISYSEGTNDDVNKIIWSDQDWDPQTPSIETLRDYARYFIHPELAEDIAQGLMALEKNLQEPLLGNDAVVRTLHQWQRMEKEAPKAVLDNFRFQMGLLRAYYDAYQYRRLGYETELEQRARDFLRSAGETGSEWAIQNATATLALAQKVPIMTRWKARCHELADALFLQIGAQLTVEKHGAMSGRGNFIDTMDVPLNDALWIVDQLTVIKGISSEDERLKAIARLMQRTDPGPGGYYDNMGSPESWKRVVAEKERTEDPGNLASPRVSFGVGLKGEEWVHEVTAKGFEGQSTPLAWMNQITSLYETPLHVLYKDLDPNSSYSIRVAYTGRFRSKMKMTIDGVTIHDFMQTGERPLQEFNIPDECLEDGKIKITWTCGQGERGSQVSEIWIIKQQN
ncbi:MAG: hypothetical protein AAGA86_03115 [Bacteroidota bacterium]